MRRTLPWVLIAALALSLGMVAYTQRSGPTAEDKALAARMIQDALRDALGIADPADRAEGTRTVYWASTSHEEWRDKPPVNKEQALDLLRKALDDARKLPGDQCTKAIERVLNAAAGVDYDAAQEWALELEKSGVKMPEEWSSATRGESPFSAPVARVQEMVGKDLNAAVKLAEQIKDPADRMAAKALLARRIVQSGLSERLGTQLLNEAGSLAERLPVTATNVSELLALVSDLQPSDPARALRLLRRIYDQVATSADAEYRAERLDSIADGGFGGGEYAGTDRASRAAIQAIVDKAAKEARAAALSLPADHRLHRRAVWASFREALYGEARSYDHEAGTAPVLGSERFPRALEWARQIPVENGRRVSALLRVADAAFREAPDLAREVLSEARDLLPAPETSWSAVNARAACIATAAIAGDKRCWEWAIADADRVRGAELPTVEGATGIPMEFRRAYAESIILAATFGSGDIQRAKRFLEKQSRLGGYDVARAFWCDLVYFWDPSHSRELAEKLLADMKASHGPLRACIAGAAAAPAFAYEALVPDIEVADRGEALFDEALGIAGRSDLPADGALAAAGLAAVSASVDAVRSGRAVDVAKQALLGIREDATRDHLAPAVCSMLAVAAPQAAADLTANVKDPMRRLDARLSAVSGMLFDLKAMRDDWRRSLTGMPLGLVPGAYEDYSEDEPAPIPATPAGG